MRKGSAAVILTIIVLGFMMAVSMSYVTMVQTETRAQTSIDKSARAKDAAFSGVSYVLARLMATSSTFLVDNTQSIKQKRLYFAYDATAGSKNIRFQSLVPGDFNNVASSQWLFPATPELLPNDETASSIAFRVTSYPAEKTTGGATDIVPNYYYVKSQGRYLDIEGGSTVTATYTAQILARLQIATPTFQVSLERYQTMEVESDAQTGAFFTKRPAIYP